jgi:vacuolar-type H+-ATPase subunit E/Vma4
MLLESAKRKLESAKQEIRDAAAAQGATQKELTELEKVLTGKIFEDAGDVLLNSGATPPSFQKLLESQGSSNLSAAISDLQTLAGEIQSKVLDKIGQNQSFAAKYAELLQAYFMTGEGRVGRFSGKTYTE